MAVEFGSRVKNIVFYEVVAELRPNKDLNYIKYDFLMDELYHELAENLDMGFWGPTFTEGIEACK
jgi:hypothetical protein